MTLSATLSVLAQASEPENGPASDLTAGESAPVVFADCLQGEAHAALRRSLRDRLRTRRARLESRRHDSGTQLLHVDVLPTVRPEHFAPNAETILLLDVHRLLVLRPRPDAARREVESALRYLLGAYPIQPLRRLAERIDATGFRMLYPLTVLDLVSIALDELEAGEIATLDLIHGTVDRRPLLEHVEAGTGSADATRPHVAPREPFGRLDERHVDASLRADFPRPLDDLVGAAGIVQRRFTLRERLSLPFATAEVCWNAGHHREPCYGKTTRADRAATVAVCEALERFQVATRPPSAELVAGSYDQLAERAIDPRKLFFGSEVGDDVGSETSHLPPFDPSARLYWTWASPAGHGEPVLVPAQEVWFHTKHLPGETTFIQPTTNACALGGSHEEAALFALLEAAERDAFLTAWYLRRPARAIDLDTVTDPAFQHLRHRWQLAYPGYRARLFDITTDLALPAVLAVAVRGDQDHARVRDRARDHDRNGPRASGEPLRGPKIFVAIACRLTAVAACLAAFEDLSGFDPVTTPQRQARRESLWRDPSTIGGPADHFGYYALDAPFENLAFLDLHDDLGSEAHGGALGDSRCVSTAAMQRDALFDAAEGYELRGVLETIDAQWAALDVGLYLRDLTHPVAAARGLHCVKAITPGLYPIWFGHGNRRFRPTRRLDRLARAWSPAEPIDAGAPLSINRRLHPFS